MFAAISIEWIFLITMMCGNAKTSTQETQMKAIGYQRNGPIEVSNALIEFEADTPDLRQRDILVEVRGISVNPVDVKVRANIPVDKGTKIIGYDAAGVVKAVGSDVRNFGVGDEVFYSGDLTRQGTNAELHSVDDRIVGRKPNSLSFAEAAGFPLTSITAWELLFDSLSLKEGEGDNEVLLVVGGAGGVGSILIQLAKLLTKLTVVATASRPESVDWIRQMGADFVISHRQCLVEQVGNLGFVPRYVASLSGTEGHFPSLIELIKPRGHIVLIDDPSGLDINAIKSKALSFSWEFMFARSMYQTCDMQKQGDLLNRVSEMIDQGNLASTVTSNLGRISVDSVTAAHVKQESGRSIGKTVLEGF